MQKHYEEKRKIRDALLCLGRDVHLYDLHDGNMLYLLTQHSLFTRKYNPFLLCTCGHGEGVVDPDHECVILDHEEQVHYYERPQ